MGALDPRFRLLAQSVTIEPPTTRAANVHPHASLVSRKPGAIRALQTQRMRRGNIGPISLVARFEFVNVEMVE